MSQIWNGVLPFCDIGTNGEFYFTGNRIVTTVP